MIEVILFLASVYIIIGLCVSGSLVVHDYIDDFWSIFLSVALWPFVFFGRWFH